MQLYFKGLTFQFCVGRLGDEENREPVYGGCLFSHESGGMDGQEGVEQKVQLR
jgi:hypothetical protein